MKTCVTLAAVLATSGSALAQWSDDFNRPDGPIGGDWTVVTGSWAISGNRGTHTSTPSNEILQHNLASLPYQQSVSSLDVFAPTTASQFSALLIGLGGTDAIMVKVQAQTSTGNFSHLGIYHRTSATGWGNFTGTTTLPNASTSTSGFVALVNNTLNSISMTVSFPDADTVRVDLGGGQVYTRTGVAALAGNFGTSFGIGAWGATATFDNWNVIPAPSAMALLGLAGLVASRRRRA